MKIFALIISSLIGFAIGHYLLHGAAAAFAATLISYHLYFGFLVLSTQHEKGSLVSIGQIVITHSTFLIVVVGLPYLREQIPFFSLISLLVPGMAPLEVMWLFSGQAKKARKVEEPKPSGPVPVTAEDQQEFLAYLKQGPRRFRKPGATVDDEFKAWFADRVRNRPVAVVTPEAVPDTPQALD